MKITIAPDWLQGQPDIAAMLQAFYSRSHMPIEQRLIELEAEIDDLLTPDVCNAIDNIGTEVPDPRLRTRIDKIRASLEQWYIGYGHASIGDCGSLYLFLEGVTILSAKAVQDDPKYRGQETSTRFIDFSTQETPKLFAGTDHDLWMGVYRDALPLIAAHQQALDPTLAGRAALVKACDIGRGLLPCTALTQLSWHADIRTVREHVGRLLDHPMPWVRQDAEDMHLALKSWKPDLFTSLPSDPGYEWFLADDDPLDEIWDQAIEVWNERGDYLQFAIPTLWNRYSSASKHLRRWGTGSISHQIDYGGYRDVQRHRRSYIKAASPLSLPDGFAAEYEPWYLEQMGDAARALVPAHETEITPLMQMVPTSFTADLEQMKYVIDMRTKPAVHPTVRQYFMDKVTALHDLVPALRDYGYFDVGAEVIDYNRRAKQDITRKDAQ